LNCFDKASETFTYYHHDPQEPTSLGHNGVVDLVPDKNVPYILWVGTQNGLNKFDKTTGTSTRYEPNPQDPAKGPGAIEVWRIIDKSGAKSALHFRLCRRGGCSTGILNADIALLQKPFSPIELSRRVREVLDA
jgi:hypothetical protein